MNPQIEAWLSEPLVRKGIALVIDLTVIILVIWVARRLVTNHVKSADTRYRLRKFVTIAGYLLALFIGTLIFKDYLGGLSVALGVAGAGIAFALQEVISSFAGWFAISFAHFYKPGDRVEVGGIKGDVIDISFLRTTLMECGEWVDGDLYTGRVVRVANSFVFKEPVYNYSGEFPFLWDEIKLPVRYGSDRKLAASILRSAGDEVVGEYSKSALEAWEPFSHEFLLEFASVVPAVTVEANDNWMEFTLRYVTDYKRRRATKNELFTRIIDEFNATEGKVQFASATFELVDAPAIRFRSDDK